MDNQQLVQLIKASDNNATNITILERLDYDDYTNVTFSFDYFGNNGTGEDNIYTYDEKK